MKKATIVALLATSQAFAQTLEASNGTDTVRISSKPCEARAVLQLVPKELHPLLLDATAVVQGKLYRLCWVDRGSFAHLIYEDGDQGLIPMQHFNPVRGEV